MRTPFTKVVKRAVKHDNPVIKYMAFKKTPDKYHQRSLVIVKRHVLVAEGSEVRRYNAAERN
jgi:hypothetical protein